MNVAPERPAVVLAPVGVLGIASTLPTFAILLVSAMLMLDILFLLVQPFLLSFLLLAML